MKAAREGTGCSPMFGGACERDTDLPEEPA